MSNFLINLELESIPDIQKFIACVPTLAKSVTSYILKFVSINTKVLSLEKYVQTYGNH